jgi:multimeric flavodoxin WrbA
MIGSPRSGGNSEILADNLIKGIEERGHNAIKYVVAKHKIAGCVACDRCWSKDYACAIEDDFKELSLLLEKVDGIVFAFPLYWSTVPSQLKAPIDRLYSYVSSECKRHPSIKEYALMICGECEGENIFDSVIKEFEGIATYMKWMCKGIVKVPQVFHAGSVIDTSGPRDAYHLGNSF